MSTDRKRRIHLFDFHNHRVTGRKQTRCGKYDTLPDFPHRGGKWMVIPDFDENVHDHPQEGTTYCRMCHRDYRENGC